MEIPDPSRQTPQQPGNSWPISFKRSGSFQRRQGVGGAESWILQKAADSGTGVWASSLPSSPSHHPGMLFSDEEGKSGLPVGTVPVPRSHSPLPTLTLDVRGPGLEGVTSTPFAPGAKSSASGWCFKIPAKALQLNDRSSSS